MSETWQKILQFQGEEKRKMEAEQRRLEPERLEREKIELRKKELSKQKEREENDRVNRENLRWEKRTRELSKADEIAVSILEEIRKNSKEIRQARLSQIVSDSHRFSFVSDSHDILLRWGNKFGITEEERRFLDEYRYEHYPPGRRLPESFNGEDYSEISTQIDSGNALDIITNPTILIQPLAIQLAHPRRYLKTYVKGQDYWRGFTSEAQGGR